ncbi:MAG: tRNA lysidine(34) synthetase TilS [Victivallaceae bacterium]
MDYIKDDILKDGKLKFFFSEINRKSKFLLGLSGGADSTFLFYVLKAFEIDFTASYVDHGLRPESVEEVVYLKELCKKEEVLFKTIRISHDIFDKGNSENIARDFRYRFFKNLCEKEGLEGVFIAHHADDQSETVIKRVFEGASLWNLRGLLPIARIDGLLIMRPLLHLRKQYIADRLNAENIAYFTDSTNADTHFLRARMRLEFIPILEKSFGKNITSSLERLSISSSELFEFLMAESQRYTDRIQEDEKSISLDLSFDPPRSLFLWKFILKFFLSRIHLTPSAYTLEALVQLLLKKSSHKVFRIGNKKALIDKGVLRIDL